MTDLAQDPVQLRPLRETHLLDQASVAVVVTDVAGTITYWNRGAELLYGYARDEALGRWLGALIVEEGETAFALAASEGLRAGQTWEGEFPARRKDGAPIVVGARFSPVLDDSGRVAGTVGVATDVTQRWHAQGRLKAQYAVTAVLAEAESFTAVARGILEALCESLGWVFGAIWEVDPDREVLRLVDLWHVPGLGAEGFSVLTTSTEFAPGQGLPGRVWALRKAAWIPDVATDTNFPPAAAAVEGDLHAAFGFPILRGTEIAGVIEFFSREIKEPDEDLLALMTAVGTQLGQFMDRKRAEEALRESEARKCAMLESALDAIVSMDHEGRIADFNPAAEGMFGLPQEEAVGVQRPPRRRLGVPGGAHRGPRQGSRPSPVHRIRPRPHGTRPGGGRPGHAGLPGRELQRRDPRQGPGRGHPGVELGGGAAVRVHGRGDGRKAGVGAGAGRLPQRRARDHGPNPPGAGGGPARDPATAQGRGGPRRRGHGLPHPLPGREARRRLHHRPGRDRPQGDRPAPAVPGRSGEGPQQQPGPGDHPVPDRRARRSRAGRLVHRLRAAGRRIDPPADPGARGPRQGRDRPPHRPGVRGRSECRRRRAVGPADRDLAVPPPGHGGRAGGRRE